VQIKYFNGYTNIKLQKELATQKLPK